MSPSTGTKISLLSLFVGLVLMVVGITAASLPSLVASLVPAVIGGVVKVATQHHRHA